MTVYEISYHIENDYTPKHWRGVAENGREAILQLDKDIPGARLYDVPKIVKDWEPKP